jgi:hypothetical protein
MVTEQEKIFLGELDFTKIILYQLFELLKSMNEGDIAESSTKAENLHVFMRYCWDDEYIKRRQKINQKIDERIKALGNPGNPERIGKLELLRVRRLTEALIALIARSGFLPAKDYEGVIEFDEETLKQIEEDRKAVLEKNKESEEEESEV